MNVPVSKWSALWPYCIIAAIVCGQASALLAGQKDARMLAAIAAVESGNDHRAIGDNGASLGAWQMQAAAWDEANADRRRAGKREHRRSAWADPLVQQEMAASFLSVIRSRFAAAGRPDPSPEQIAVVWNRGWSAAKRTGFRPSDYARRVGNIYRLQGS